MIKKLKRLLRIGDTRVWKSPRLGLPNTEYYDADARILYACFTIFKEYYENDYQNICREGLPHEAVIEELYQYWKGYASHWSGDTWEIEQEMYEKEQEMLTKLISVRAYLWY